METQQSIELQSNEHRRIKFVLLTRRPYYPGGPKKLCFTTLSLIPMVSIARLSVVKQSPFGLPGQYGRRVTRVNCSHQRGQRWKTVCILLQGLSSVDVLSVRRILRRLQHRYSNDLLCFGFVFPSFLSFLFFSFFVSFGCFSSIF